VRDLLVYQLSPPCESRASTVLSDLRKEVVRYHWSREQRLHVLTKRARKRRISLLRRSLQREKEELTVRYEERLQLVIASLNERVQSLVQELLQQELTSDTRFIRSRLNEIAGEKGDIKVSMHEGDYEALRTSGYTVKKNFTLTVDKDNCLRRGELRAVTSRGSYVMSPYHLSLK
jgi:hypothetical protein